MPNWAFGEVQVKGKPKDIENFCKLFVFEDEADKEIKKTPYFARSFIHSSWKDFKKDNLGKKVTEAEFDVDFAWSCWSCLFEGYPNKKEGFVTLKWACKEYNVEVEIETEEEGMGFEEKIITKNGKPIYKSSKMPTYKCQACGSEQIFSRGSDLDDTECYECGKVGKWKDELTELLKKKVEQTKEK